MSTARKLSPQLDPVAHAEAPGARTLRKDRAHRRASWASAQSAARELGRVLGISESRVRHQRTDDQRGALTLVCAAAADPHVDGEAILAAVEEAVEDRYAETPPSVLEERLRHLIQEAEHVAESQQNRALMMGGPGTNDALRKHARLLREICAIRERLGLEERVN